MCNPMTGFTVNENKIAVLVRDIKRTNVHSVAKCSDALGFFAICLPCVNGTRLVQGET